MMRARLLLLWLVIRVTCSVPDVSTSLTDSRVDLVSKFIQDVLEDHFQACTFVLAHDYPSQIPSELLNLVNQHSHPSLSVRTPPYDPKEAVVPKKKVNGTLVFPWPLRKSATHVGSCVLYAVVFNYANASRVLEHLSNKVFVHPQTHYFMFWIRDGGDMSGVLTSSEGRLVRRKLGLTVSTNGLELSTVCFYCNGGKPTVVPVPEHDRNATLTRLYPDTTTDLNGKSLRGTFATPYSPDSLKQKRENGEGVLAVEAILEDLSRNMNFQWDVLENPAGEAAHLNMKMEDGTWVGMVAEVLYQEVEFCPASIMTDEAYDFVDLTMPYYMSAVTFITSKPKEVFRWRMIVKPFTIGLWMAMMVSVTCSSAILYVYVRWRKARREKKALSEVVTSTLTEPVHRKRFSIKALGGVCFILVTIGSCVYQSKLVALVIRPPKENRPASFQELLSSGYRFGAFVYHVLFLQIMAKNVELETIKVLADKVESTNSLEECMELAMTTRFACVSAEDYLVTYAGAYFREDGENMLLLAPDNVISIYVGYVMPKHHVSTPAMNSLLLRMLSAGYEDRYERDYDDLIKWNGIKSARQEERDGTASSTAGVGSRVRSWRHFSVPFFWLSMGLAFSIVVFGCEAALSRCFRQRKYGVTKSQKR